MKDLDCEYAYGTVHNRQASNLVIIVVCVRANDKRGHLIYTDASIAKKVDFFCIFIFARGGKRGAIRVTSEQLREQVPYHYPKCGE